MRVGDEISVAEEINRSPDKAGLSAATNVLKNLLKVERPELKFSSIVNTTQETSQDDSNNKKSSFYDSFSLNGTGPVMKTNSRKSSPRHLLVSDGTAGYGGSEFLAEEYTIENAPEAKVYKWNLLFPSFPEDIRKKIILDNVSFFSVTDIVSADSMSNILVELLEKKSVENGRLQPRVIIDATACVGGNTFSFMKSFDKVYALELDEKRAEILSKNLEVVWSHFHDTSILRKKNYEIIIGDCLKEIPKLLISIDFVDVLFFDPPWGGELYKNKGRGNVCLFLSGKSIGSVCKDLAADSLSSKWRYIAIKIPAGGNTVDIDGLLKDATGCSLVGEFDIGSKLRLIVLESSRKSRVLNDDQLSMLVNLGLNSLGSISK